MRTFVHSSFWTLALALGLAFVSQPLTGQGQREIASRSEYQNPLDVTARLSIAEIPLSNALATLTRNSGVTLVYSPSKLPENLVSCECYALRVRDALDQLLRGTVMQYSVFGQNVVIEPKRLPAYPENVPARLADHRSSISTLPMPSTVFGNELRNSPVSGSPVGTITGVVTDARSGQPVAAAQVSIAELGLGTLTTQDGHFTLRNVSAGSYALVFQRIGYQESRQRGVTIGAGGTISVNREMDQVVLALQEIVATGLVDPVEGVRSPIAVARVGREMMPSTVAGNAVTNLQGIVAGLQVRRASGQPGEAVSTMLRTPTSIRGSGAPLIVVDGVILGGDQSTLDIDGMDIESVEVIRGAAAASLYGSRAAAGVVAITTTRGSELSLGQTRFSARTEIGFSQAIEYDFHAKHHYFLMDPTNSFYVDEQGRQVDRDDRVTPPLHQAFLDKPYPGSIYDNVDALSRPGAIRSNNLSMSGNSLSTNFAVTVNSMHEEGVLVNNDGYYRNNFRVNLDHRFRDSFSLGVSLYHSRAGRDEIAGGNVFNSAVQAPLDVDFSAKGPDGQYLQQPDPAVPIQNPLWTQATRESYTRTNRTLANWNLSWSPVPWITTSGAIGYDRGDSWSRTYVPKGTPADVGSSRGELDGSLSLENTLADTWNAEGQISLRRDIGNLNLRTTFRGLMEYDHSEAGTRSGEGFLLYGVPQLSNIPESNRNATSSEVDRRALGYLWDTAFDYTGKYVLTVLGRRDGSSLFGPDNRWHNYYRVAGAWRIGEEYWFNIPHVSEFKISFARGTAGGRPGQTAQYETWSTTEAIPTKDALGNRYLRPEHTTENEVSLNLVLADRIGVVLTHARQTTTDQLTTAPQSVVTGYTSQWVNAGTISGHSTELEIEGRIIQRSNLLWTTTIVADYSNSVITEWPLPCDGTLGFRNFCEGAPVFGFYSSHIVGRNDNLENALRKHRGGSALPYINQFQMNDEGLVVWVGEGNSYRDGIAKNLWGTVSGDIGGRTYEWGHPFQEEDEWGNYRRQLLGEANPVNVGWNNSIRLGGFNLFAQLHASIGTDANNRGLWELINNRTARTMDAVGKPDGLKKPLSYYIAANRPSDYYIEKADYLKLRTLSVNYSLGQARLQGLGLRRIGLQSLGLGLVGRNLFTWSTFSGFDPEGPVNLATRFNSPIVTYPPTRSLTAEITVTF